jgi:hypothetical protein
MVNYTTLHITEHYYYDSVFWGASDNALKTSLESLIPELRHTAVCVLSPNGITSCTLVTCHPQCSGAKCDKYAGPLIEEPSTVRGNKVPLHQDGHYNSFHYITTFMIKFETNNSRAVFSVARFSLKCEIHILLKYCIIYDFTSFLVGCS